MEANIADTTANTATTNTDNTGQAGVQSTVTEQPFHNVQPNTPPEPQAPVVPPTPEPALEPDALKAPTEVPETPEDDYYIPEELGDIKQVRGLFEIAKAHFPDLDLNRVMQRAWETGDPELVDVNHIREVAGEDYAEYYGEYFKDLVQEYTEFQSHTLEQWTHSVFDKVGGKENWERVANVFNSTADDGVRGHVKDLLNSSDQVSRDRGVEIILMAARLAGAMPERGGRSLDRVSATPAASGAGLSGPEYQQAYRELLNSNNYTQEDVQRLQQRRLIGLQQNL